MTVPMGAAPAAEAATGGPDDGTQTVRRMVWNLAPADAEAGKRSLAGRRVAVIGGTPSVADGVRAELLDRGADLVGERRGRVPDTLVDLTLSEPFVPGDTGQWRHELLRTFDWLRHCYGEWSEETAVGRLSYLAVTYLGGGMGYHQYDDLAQPLGGLWAGLAKTLHRELPNCSARIVDTSLADLDQLPERVADELCLTGLSEIGHRDGQRWTLTPEVVAPGPAKVAWDASDTVLISGGGRGIGMALARRLAGEFGMRVVVTGRSDLPPPETWAGLTAAALNKRRDALWAQHGEGRPVAGIRRDIARAENTWEVVGNLLSARAEGLRIDYLPCDFTNREEVGALVAGLSGLTAVVHNAGVDRPTRLPRKSDADITDVVATKVDSFVHVLEAVRGRKLKLLCIVGSLTGRLGGMVGQFDYAAANECLARLGKWAQRQVSFPVMTLAWPTWARLGLIANFEASLRYMAAMDVTEGLDHWRAELLAATSGEVSFVGPLGQALDPVQAVSYPMPPCLPGFVDTYPKVFHLGTPEVYRPQAQLVGLVEFDAETTPAVRDFSVHGVPALPVGLLVENAVRGAEWLVPERLHRKTLLAVEDLSVPWSLLRCGSNGRVRLRRDLRGETRGGRWTVDAVFRTDDGTDEGPAARLRLVYGEKQADNSSELPPTGRPAGEAVLFTDRPVLHWGGLAMPLAAWRGEGPNKLVTEVGRCHPGDLWALPQPPAFALPIAAIENIVRAVTERMPGLSTTPDPLTVSAISLRGPAPDRTRIDGDPALGVWRVTDAANGAPVAVLHRPPGHTSWPTEPPPQPTDE
ncbi:KR domain-containing protein [Streptomyces sp. NPDC004647]|uniref:KR domain-containing protein n=1 Tax=Streptomyces sp. NPDC004647 TaxID=3154671 RepID=UPI0033BEE5CE